MYNPDPNTTSRKIGTIAIVGAGIGGMQAALDLADSGFLVHLISRDSSIGGTMAMLDKTFPTGDCAMCMISPRMVEIGRHPNIRLHTLAEVKGVSGKAGDFTLTVTQQARYVDAQKCTGCGICEQRCPSKTNSEFDQDLAKRRSIFTMLPQAVPNTRVIDDNHCLYLQKGRCRACEKYCQAGAINFTDARREFPIHAGAVILTPGLARYNPRVRPELGFGRWPNVVTSMQFERILSASGPYRGEVKRPSDGRHPRRIAWIQCVGSRDPHNANSWCSSVCCMYATKQSVIAKEHDSRIDATIFYMDLRTFGKDFDRYVARARDEHGVRYKQAMISSVYEESGTGDLVLRYADGPNGMQEETFDLVVLSIGFEPDDETRKLADIFGIQSDEYGFAATSSFAPVNTSRPGIFVAGTYQAPKDIPETVVQASAVAAKARALLNEVRGQEIEEIKIPPERDVNGKEAGIGVFVCHCGINISQTVDVDKVAAHAAELPGVRHSQTLLYACSPDGQERIKSMISEKGLNRVVVASCTPRTHQDLFQDTIRETGLNKYLFELADIREQCSWCHMGQREAATDKALDIVRMNVAKARLLQPVTTDTIEVHPSALVIGGGIAGMTAARSIADQGFQVYLVEKNARLGGLAANVQRTLEGENVRNYIRTMITDVEQHPLIAVHTGTKIQRTDGYVGNFVTTLANSIRLEHGVVLIASGGMEYEPTEYGYGKLEGVITQRQLEYRLAARDARNTERYVMIQCVGSREEPTNYCSRICCMDAVKNAIAIKEKAPAAQVVILYRDIRTYGLREDFYRKARNLGVLFLKYQVTAKPEVSRGENGLRVTVHDQYMDRDIILDADHVVLSTGLRPGPENKELGKIYKLTTNDDGFFLEAHVKLKPVDFPSEGIFLAGLAHAPKNIDETISQSLAAAGRAGVLLACDRLTVSGIIAKHDRRKCMSCLACFRACPFGSPYIDEDGKVSHNEIKCTGCGICAGICPAKAFQVNSFDDRQVHAMIDALADESEKTATIEEE